MASAVTSTRWQRKRSLALILPTETPINQLPWTRIPLWEFWTQGDFTVHSWSKTQTKPNQNHRKNWINRVKIIVLLFPRITLPSSCHSTALRTWWWFLPWRQERLSWWSTFLSLLATAKDAHFYLNLDKIGTVELALGKLAQLKHLGTGRNKD